MICSWRWTQYCLSVQANFCSDPIEVYSYLHGQGVGTQTAALYVDWAYQLEKTGQLSQAEMVYQRAQENKAQPQDSVLQQYMWVSQNGPGTKASAEEFIKGTVHPRIKILSEAVWVFFYCWTQNIFWKSVAAIHCLVTHILQNIIFCAPQKKEIQYRFATTTWGWTIPLKCMHLSIIKILSPSKCLIELCCICRVLQARMSVSAQTAASGRVACACGLSLVMLWARRVTCTLLSLDWLRSCAATSAELTAGEPEPQTERRCSRPAQGTAPVYYCRSQVMNVKVEVTVQ